MGFHWWRYSEVKDCMMSCWDEACNARLSYRWCLLRRSFCGMLNNLAASECRQDELPANSVQAVRLLMTYLCVQILRWCFRIFTAALIRRLGLLFQSVKAIKQQANSYDDWDKLPKEIASVFQKLTTNCWHSRQIQGNRTATNLNQLIPGL